VTVFTPLDTFSSEPIGPRVYREIRDAIVCLRLKPGQIISEADVARQFGASRQPVHDAFVRLQASGLLHVLPQRGTRVARISPKDVRDAQVIRRAIEAATVARACERRRPESLAALKANVARQEASAGEREPRAFLKLDEEFHRLLAACADLEMAWTIIEDAKSHMDRVRYLSLPQTTPVATLVRQHKAIVAGIAAGDASAALAALTEHFGEIDKSLPALEAEYPELFEHDEARAEPMVVR
jgi:GntR family transcriptional regulator, rspAB operon transcriptional repressor